jgi:hypothetical protein
MNPEDPDRDRIRRGMAIGIAAGGLLCVAWWMRTDRQAPELSPPARPSIEAPVSTTKAAGTPPPSTVGAAPAPAPPAVTLPVTVLPGHEGHGDECAECVAERKLAAYREDYARLEFAQAVQGRVLPADQSAALQDACRRFSRAVLREWSFSESKPRLPDDAIVNKLRSEMLQPLIERLPLAAEDPP